MQEQSNAKPILINLGIGIFVLIIVGGLAWYVTWEVPAFALHLWAVIATLLIVPALMFGWWSGRTEVRGFLSGADHMIDRSMQVFTRAVDYRDSSFTRRAQTTQTMAPPDPRQMASMFQVPMMIPPSPDSEIDL